MPASTGQAIGRHLLCPVHHFWTTGLPIRSERRCLVPDYRVRWEIDIEAESYQEAAEAALAIQRDPASIATVFDVRARGEATLMRVDLEPPVHVQPRAPADDDDL
jgi:hypothetical protein